MDESLVLEIEEHLRRYLQAHPQAIDNERGIYEWWLRGASRSYPVTDVRDAIERLVATGELIRLTLPDGGYTYASSASTRSRSP